MLVPMTAEGTRIRILSAHVANKIAAGEVVDRPASVVKELMENALDAGATQVDVEIVAGGRKLVAVGDDGGGMSRDDALLSVERHATSKIHDVDDIERIATLGFRGEALAAIASVSRFRLVTATGGTAAGTELTIAGGRIQDVRDTGCPRGTRIEVRDLFFNVPARRKFLRSYQTEMIHVRSCFITQSLAHPAAGMSLTVDGRPAYRLPPGGTAADRIRDLFSPDYRKDLKDVAFEAPGMAVHGFVSSPALHRADRGEQYFFVNGRVTSSPILNHGLREGYRGALPPDRQPCVFLYIEMDPAQVDVNVHPTKREVRFRQPSAVRDVVAEAVRRALSGAAGAAQAAAVLPAAEPLPRLETQLRIENLGSTHTFRYPRLTGDAAAGAASPAARADSASATAGDADSAPQSNGEPKAKPGAPWSWCRVLGQVGGLYVVMETEDGLVVMDPRAAHERVLFERLMESASGGLPDTQDLLIPETVELTPRDAERLRKNLGVLKQMGFGVSEFGGHAFVVDAVPVCLAGVPVRDVLAELPQGIEEAGSRRAQGRWIEETVARAASKAAVQTRDRLTLEEIEALVVDLAQTRMPYTSPRGRPTLSLTTVAELHRKFGRE